MADFTKADDIVASLANTGSRGGRINYNFVSQTTVSGFWYSSWLLSKYAGPGGTPSSAAQCVQTTAGSLGTFNNTTGSGVNRLVNWQNATGSAAVDFLFDRLCHMGGLSANLNTSQTVSLDLVTASGNGRCAANGSDVEWFIEVFSAGGATNPVSITVTYTNESGTGSRTATISGLASSAFPVGRLYPIMPYLQSGDVAIKSIQSIQLNTASGTAGNIGVVAAKRYAKGFSSSIAGYVLDYPAVGMPQIPNDACLWIVSFMAGASSGIKTGTVIIGGTP